MRASSATRSCDFARAEERLAASSAAQARTARATTTASSDGQRRTQLRGTPAVDERARDDVREQPRLRDDQQCAERAERDRDEEERAGRARVPEQSRIERSHDAIMTRPGA